MTFIKNIFKQKTAEPIIQNKSNLDYILQEIDTAFDTMKKQGVEYATIALQKNNDNNMEGKRVSLDSSYAPECFLDEREKELMKNLKSSEGYFKLELLIDENNDKFVNAYIRNNVPVLLPISPMILTIDSKSYPEKYFNKVFSHWEQINVIEKDSISKYLIRSLEHYHEVTCKGSEVIFDVLENQPIDLSRVIYSLDK